VILKQLARQGIIEIQEFEKATGCCEKPERAILLKVANVV
jgi:hypothetical protein